MRLSHDDTPIGIPGTEPPGVLYPCPKCGKVVLGTTDPAERAEHVRTCQGGKPPKRRAVADGQRRNSELWGNAICEQTALTPKAKHVATLLAFRYMNHHTLRDARPGNARLVAETGLCLSTVHAALRELKASGVLKVQVMGGSGGAAGRQATTYRGVPPAKWPQRAYRR